MEDYNVYEEEVMDMDYYVPSKIIEKEDISQADIDDNKFLALLCYFNIFIIIPLYARPKSRWIRFHANQAIIIFLSYVICGFLFIIPLIGWILGIILGLINIICVILGIVNVCTGKANRLPFIGKYNIIRDYDR